MYMYICSLTYFLFYNIVSVTCLSYILLFENISQCQSIYYVLKTCICLKQIKLLYCILYCIPRCHPDFTYDEQTTNSQGSSEQPLPALDNGASTLELSDSHLEWIATRVAQELPGLATVVNSSKHTQRSDDLPAECSTTTTPSQWLSSIRYDSGDPSALTMKKTPGVWHKCRLSRSRVYSSLFREWNACRTRSVFS